jgi:hypothetical protein
MSAGSSKEGSAPGGDGANRKPPSWAYDLLAAVPRAGEGVNLWLFKVARVWHAFRSEAEIVEMLAGAVDGCGRIVRRAEIQRAVARSKPYALGYDETISSKVEGPWPPVDLEKRRAILSGGARLVELWEQSPDSWKDSAPHTEEIIDALFPGNPLLCVGRKKWDFRTRPREEWRGRLAHLQLITPSPMIARTGPTQDGKESHHTLANTGARRFLVIEFDSGTPGEQAALVLHLAESAPLALALHSGGKSLHAWFYCEGQPEARLRAFMCRAVALGADKAMWPRFQFARMPDARRDNGKRQVVYYFNPGVVK